MKDQPISSATVTPHPPRTVPSSTSLFGPSKKQRRLRTCRSWGEALVRSPLPPDEKQPFLSCPRCICIDHTPEEHQLCASWFARIVGCENGGRSSRTTALPRVHLTTLMTKSKSPDPGLVNTSVYDDALRYDRTGVTLALLSRRSEFHSPQCPA